MLDTVDAFRSLFDILAALAGAISLIGPPITMIRHSLRINSRLAKFALIGGILSSELVVFGIFIALYPFLSAQTATTATTATANNTMIGNWLSVAGLGLGAISWLLALDDAFQRHKKQWLLIGVLLVIGIPVYSLAIVYNDFFSYLAVGVAPIIYGLVAFWQADTQKL